MILKIFLYISYKYIYTYLIFYILYLISYYVLYLIFINILYIYFEDISNSDVKENKGVLLLKKDHDEEYFINFQLQMGLCGASFW